MNHRASVAGKVILALAAIAVAGLALQTVFAPSASTGSPDIDTATSTPEPTDTTEPAPTYTYTITDESARDRSIRPAIENAVAFWNRTATFTLSPATKGEPDFKFVSTDRIRSCLNGSTATTYSYCIAERSDHTRVAIPNVFEQPVQRRVSRLALGYALGFEEPTDIAGVRPLPAQPAVTGPWPTKDVITVNLSVESNPGRDWATLVEPGIDYWQTHDDRYGNYSQDMVFRPNANRADVTVRIVDEINKCGHEPGPYSGCSNILSGDLIATGHSQIRIVSDLDADSTAWVAKHEFGHLYGRLHHHDPAEIMRIDDPGLEHWDGN